MPGWMGVKRSPTYGDGQVGGVDSLGAHVEDLAPAKRGMLCLEVGHHLLCNIAAAAREQRLWSEGVGGGVG